MEKKEEGGMIENHLKRIKALGAWAAVKQIVDIDRGNVLGEFMKSDFYQKHKFDFPKSIITHTKYPEELHEWREATPTDFTEATEQLRGENERLKQDNVGAIKRYIAKDQECEALQQQLTQAREAERIRTIDMCDAYDRLSSLVKMCDELGIDDNSFEELKAAKQLLNPIK